MEARGRWPAKGGSLRPPGRCSKWRRRVRVATVRRLAGTDHAWRKTSPMDTCRRMLPRVIMADDWLALAQRPTRCEKNSQTCREFRGRKPYAKPFAPGV